MAADSRPIFVGTLDTSKAGRFLSLDVSQDTAGTFQYVGQYGFSAGSWSCSIKRSLGTGAPQAFPTALAFTSSAVTQPATDAADLSGVQIVVFTNDVAGTGLVDIYYIGKSD